MTARIGDLRFWVPLVALALGCGTRVSEPEKEAKPPLKQLGDNVWLDLKNKQVLLKAKVVLRRGELEMLVCLKNSKEHESILAVETQARIVHTALLLAGAEPGSPVQFMPEYRPATGQEIDIQLEWQDDKGKTRRARAQDWVRNFETRKAMEYPWVFAGSGFSDNVYLAESGDLICVANFDTAMLDLPIPSSQKEGGLLFEAFTEHIPPVGTEVTISLRPVVQQDSKSDPTKGDPEPQKGEQQRRQRSL